LVFFICSIISYRRYTAEFRKRIDSTDAMRYAQGEKGCAGIRSDMQIIDNKVISQLDFWSLSLFLYLEAQLYWLAIESTWLDLEWHWDSVSCF
jgi:hypothetical protein